MLNDLITNEDALLAESVRAGNQHSFSALYDKYAPALLGIINKIVDDKHVAEDILSQTFVNAWDQRTFCAISYNSLFNWLINLARKTASVAVKSNEQKNHTGTNNVDMSIENNTVNNTAFDLVYYKGMTCIDAATVLNISVEEVKTSIRMTIKKVKENKVAC